MARRMIWASIAALLFAALLPFAPLAQAAVAGVLGVFSRHRFDVTGPKATPLLAEEVRRSLQGKSYLVVGGTRGIGGAIAEDLLKQGAERVDVVGRTPNEEMKAAHESKRLGFLKVDMSRVTEVLRFAQDHDVAHYDGLVLTTGLLPGKYRAVTADGFEADFFVSYACRYILAREFASRGFGSASVTVVGEGRRPRAFVMGFPGGALGAAQLADMNWEREPYRWIQVHANTQLGNEALPLHMASNNAEAGNMLWFGLNPGVIDTGILDDLPFRSGSLVRWFAARFMQSAADYASGTMTPLLTSPEVEAWNGALFNRFGERIGRSQWLRREENVQAIWDATERTLAGHWQPPRVKEVL